MQKKIKNLKLPGPQAKALARDHSLEEDCEHDFDPDEGFHCLNCGKDGSEEVMSRAFDRAKSLRQDG